MGDSSATAAPTAALLTVRDLRVVIDGVHVLHGVDLDVAPTGVTALLGRNGAGKTTTVRAVMGLVPRTGSVRLHGGGSAAPGEGTELSALPTHLVVRQGIGYAPEDRGVFAGLTVAENLRLAERAGTPAYPLVHELFPELRRRAGQLAGTLSGGQQQMLAIGRTLLNGNRLIIADEPTKGLAPKIVAEVAEALARVAETVPVLLVEQNLALVRRLAGRCTVLADGRTAHTGDTAELLADEEAARRLLGVGGRAGRGSEVGGDGTGGGAGAGGGGAGAGSGARTAGEVDAAPAAVEAVEL
ncbi:ABC transporter ATP-binding protein [Kitasatospora sp. NPDC002227]|uniref:ABC transporter ATP-binding protein n=1 Tax=Kitasatospora sp. NPDC002227 TaxID=3154773 RepID=UPI00331AF44E